MKSAHLTGIKVNRWSCAQNAPQEAPVTWRRTRTGEDLTPMREVSHLWLKFRIVGQSENPLIKITSAGRKALESKCVLEILKKRVDNPSYKKGNEIRTPKSCWDDTKKSLQLYLGCKKLFLKAEAQSPQISKLLFFWLGRFKFKAQTWRTWKLWAICGPRWNYTIGLCKPVSKAISGCAQTGPVITLVFIYSCGRKKTEEKHLPAPTRARMQHNGDTGDFLPFNASRTRKPS